MSAIRISELAEMSRLRREASVELFAAKARLRSAEIAVRRAEGGLAQYRMSPIREPRTEEGLMARLSDALHDLETARLSAGEASEVLAFARRAAAEKMSELKL